MEGSFKVEPVPATFQAVDPSTGETLPRLFEVSTLDDVTEACARADAAFDVFRDIDPGLRASFLETIADGIDALGDALVNVVGAETGLPQARLVSERGRTTGQLRMFAEVVRRRRWAGLTFEAPLPSRLPLPRSDLRQRRIALGPVAVFGASNFPLAFSAAGVLRRGRRHRVGLGGRVSGCLQGTSGASGHIRTHGQGDSRRRDRLRT